MQDIKTKEHDRSPKTRYPAHKMPKELVRTAVLEIKEKSASTVGAADAKDSQTTSPTEYASGKVTSAEEWVTGKTGNAAVFAGKKLAEKSYEKIKERRRRTRAEETAGEAVPRAEQEVSEEVKNSFPSVNPEKGAPSTSAVQRKTDCGQADIPPKVRVKPESAESIRVTTGREVKTAPKLVKTSPFSHEKIKTSQTAASQKQAFHTVWAAKHAASKTAEGATNARVAGKAAKTTVRGLQTAVRGVVSSVKAMGALLASAGGIVVVFIVIVGIIAGAMFSGSSQSAEPLSQEVLNYTSAIQKYATEYGIPNYVSVLQAIVMQESGGRGTDPMQSSECPYNTRFPNSPNAITEPEYSIQVGVQYYARCVEEAGCDSPADLNKLKLSLQGYNYGNGYITWAIRNYGGYSEENALQFSQEQAASHGWARYGDPEYVAHVLRYYSSGNLFAGLFGNEQIVTVAKAQLGNEGGQKFWSWYGFGKREEWCACFVSWCADQSGLITSGSVPKFSYCPTGVEWFKGQGRWKDGGSYTPVAGTIIFFDWLKKGVRDGVSDHVGIVEKCEDGIVYTIEGNSSDEVKQRSYPIGADDIMGYGLLK